MPVYVTYSSKIKFLTRMQIAEFIGKGDSTFLKNHNVFLTELICVIRKNAKMRSIANHYLLKKALENASATCKGDATQSGKIKTILHHFGIEVVLLKEEKQSYNPELAEWRKALQKKKVLFQPTPPKPVVAPCIPTNKMWKGSGRRLSIFIRLAKGEALSADSHNPSYLTSKCDFK